MTRRITVSALGPWGLALAAIAAVGSLASGQAHPGVIVGTVTSLPARTPLGGAVIEAAGTNLRAVTDSAGYFRAVGFGVGQVRLHARAIGHEPLVLIVVVRADSAVRIDLELSSLAALPAVAVVGSGLNPGDERMHGFHERRTAGFGRFITRADIERRDFSDSRELLRGMPGVRFVGNRIQMSSGVSSRNCSVQYFVDALHVVGPPGDFLAQFRPSDLEGVEVYRGPAETPLAFSRGGAECGVIVLWTRAPGGKR